MTRSSRAVVALGTLAIVLSVAAMRPGDAAPSAAAVAPVAPVAPAAPPQEPGQAAFAAIAEIVSILQADPGTDWSRVDIGALREHLVDMDRVVVEADVEQRSLPTGVEVTVRGSDAVLASARRMVEAHRSMVTGGTRWTVETADRGDALLVTWTTSDPSEVTRLQGLGLFGFLAQGSHHPHHHLMIATGMNPHGGGE